MTITISTGDPEVVITGHTDGSVIISNVRTGEACVTPNAHTRPVCALDTMRDCVVSAGHDHMINVYQRRRRCLVLMASIRMPSTPTSIKLVKIGYRRCVMVVCRGLACVEYYTTQVPTTLVGRFGLNNSLYGGPQSFTHLEIQLDETRRHYVIAANDTPNLRIIFGAVGQHAFRSSIVEGAPQNEHSVPKLSRGSRSPYVWVAGVDEFVRLVRISNGTVVHKLDGNVGFVRDVHVIKGDRELVTAIGDLGVQRWYH